MRRLGPLFGHVLGAVIFLAGAMPSAQAAGHLCLTEITRQEQAAGMPNGLLRAIATVESGRRAADGSRQPWPWTLNVNGQGRFFDSQDAAGRDLSKHLRGGASVDVGCMQINLTHHPNAFAAPLDALDPARNVAYAVRFLSALYQETGSWRTAVSYYHSRTPSLAEAYGRRVVAALNSPLGEGYAGRLASAALAPAEPLGANYRPRDIQPRRSAVPGGDDAAALLSSLRESRRLMTLSRRLDREDRAARSSLLR